MEPWRLACALHISLMIGLLTHFWTVWMCCVCHTPLYRRGHSKVWNHHVALDHGYRLCHPEPA